VVGCLALAAFLGKPLIVLPVFRRGSSRDSFEGDLAAQLERIADETGVPQTL
jgi:hypothetical protein